MAPFLFFFSYARDDQDPLLLDFYKDLDSAVSRRAGLRKGEHAGFFDQSEIEIGEDWPVALASALNTAAVLVSIYTPVYFAKPYCGREFAVFQQRQRNTSARTKAQGLLPVLWLPSAKAIPEHIADVQYTDATMPLEYSVNGLEHLRRLRRYRERYKEVVLALASRIINAAESPLPKLRTLPNVKNTPNAFELATQPAGATTSSGPASVSFVYVTEQRNGPLRWVPYPPPDNHIWKLTNDIARRNDMVPQHLPVDDRLLDKLKQASRNNEVVLLLVDSRTVTSESLLIRMRDYDIYNSRNCAALVVWPNDEVADDATVGELVELAFPNSVTRDQLYFQRSIRSVAELTDAIDRTLKRIQSQIISTASDAAAQSSRRIPVLANIL